MNTPIEGSVGVLFREPYVTETILCSSFRILSRVPAIPETERFILSEIFQVTLGHNLC